MQQENIVSRISSPPRTFSAERVIPAEPLAIWSVLTDRAALVAGGFGLLQLEGDLGPGGKLRLVSDVAPDRVFRLTVVEWAPPRRMVWQGGMPMGLFTGRREFTLDTGNGGTRVRISESFNGVLAGAIVRAMPDLQPSFDQFADALAARFAQEMTV